MVWGIMLTMSHIIELTIPLKSKGWNYSEITSLNPEKLHLSVYPKQLTLDGIIQSRLELGSILDCEICDNTIKLTIKDCEKLRESSLYGKYGAKLCFASLGRTYETCKESQYYIGNYMFIYWGEMTDVLEHNFIDMKVHKIQ